MIDMNVDPNKIIGNIYKKPLDFKIVKLGSFVDSDTGKIRYFIDKIRENGKVLTFIENNQGMYWIDRNKNPIRGINRKEYQILIGIEKRLNT